MIFASSREVYGEAATLPVSESTPLRPLNAYGRAKVIGEAVVLAARSAGLRTVVLRLSNVYGSPLDHHDRVVPAFLRAALGGTGLRVEGGQNAFDFTYLDDAVAGFVAAIDAVEAGHVLPPIQLVTGRATTLATLAALAVELTGSSAPIIEAPPRTFDVSRFEGDGERALRYLGWRASVDLRTGLTRLAAALREHGAGHPE